MDYKAKILLVAHAPRAFTQFSSGLPLMKMIRDEGYYVAAGGTYGEMEVQKLKDEGFDFFDFYIHDKINPMHDFKAVNKLKNILVGNKFDLINSQSAKPGIIARISGKLARTPVVLQTVHAWPFHDFVSPTQSVIYKKVERFAAKYCDGIIVDSKEVFRRGVNAKICSADHMHQVYMGVDTEIFTPASKDLRDIIRGKYDLNDDDYVVGCAARLVDGKGIDILISTIAEAKNKCTNIKCLIAGDGELEIPLKNQIKELKLEDTCFMLGRLTDMPEFYKGLDVFCLPTHREGFGVALAEAMSCGVPVVSTDVAPLDETVIDGQTGYLCPKDDVSDFAKKILKLYDDNLRSEFSGNARDYVCDNFKVDAVNRQMLDIYEELLSLKSK